MRIIQSRVHVSALSATALAFLFAAVAGMMIWFSLWNPAWAPPKEGEAASSTHRIPSLGVYEEIRERAFRRGRPIQVNIGDEVDSKTAELLAVDAEGRRPPTIAYTLGMGAFLLGVFLFSSHGFRLLSVDGKFLRPQILVSTTSVVFLGGALFFLHLTPFPALWLPIPLATYAFGRAIDRPTGMIAGLTCVLLIAFGNNHDLVMLSTAGAQVVFLCFAMGDKRRGFFHGAALWTWITMVGLVAYTAYRFSTMGRLPASDTETLMSSNLAAILGSGVFMGLASSPSRSAYELFLGKIPRNKLQNLADFSNPLLKKTAEKAPGTWQHTLAMANMAEQVANALSADSLLSRVGALYHDIGKSRQAEYFAENLAGRLSPHDTIAPIVSTDAIIAHVTQGVIMGREAGLPERVIDFIHMHHGDTVLEFFWQKNVDMGNPDDLTREDFRYPGLRPDTRETGILAIVDSVEAASRSLKPPVDAETLQDLVRRIVFEKIKNRQLNNTGFSMVDLRVITETLVRMLKSQLHVRPEYPWQKKQKAGTPAPESRNTVSDSVIHEEDIRETRDKNEKHVIDRDNGVETDETDNPVEKLPEQKQSGAIEKNDEEVIVLK